jgi:hypothetical protein
MTYYIFLNLYLYTFFLHSRWLSNTNYTFGTSGSSNPYLCAFYNKTLNLNINYSHRRIGFDYWWRNALVLQSTNWTKSYDARRETTSYVSSFGICNV